MNHLRIFLLAALVLVVFGAGETEAKNPEISYPTNAIGDIAISGDGKYTVVGYLLSSGNQDAASISLFDKNLTTPLWSYEINSQFETVDISSTGEYIVAGTSRTDRVYLFSNISNNPIWNFEVTHRVTSVTISENGQYVAVGGGDYLYLFDTDQNGNLEPNPIWIYDTGGNHSVWYHSVSISSDGEYIAIGSRCQLCETPNDKLILFNKDSNTPLWQYTLESEVRCVSLSANGEYITVGTQTELLLFEKDSNTPLWSYQPEDEVLSAEISSTGEYIVAGTHHTDRIYFFNKYSNSPLWSYQSEDRNGYLFFNSVSISSDGEYIATRDSGKLYLFDKDSSEPLWSTTPAIFPDGVAISSDGEFIAASGYWESQHSGLSIYNNYIPPVAEVNDLFPSSARIGTKITFNGSGSDADGNVVAYEWISNIDGVLSTEKNFSTTELSVGNHWISFSVLDNDGEWSYRNPLDPHPRYYVSIFPNTPPISNITSISPLSAGTLEEVTFSGNGSDSDGNIVAYLWESSVDGNLSDNKSFSMKGLSVGTHSITFQVKDNDGTWSSPSSMSLFIGLAPIPKAGVDVKVGPNTEVQFTGSGTDEDGTIVNYEWDLNGDGVYDWSSTLNGITTHIYNSEGTYTAVLRLTDNDGITATDSRTIIVGGGGDDGESSLSSVTMISALISIGLLAIFRRK